MRIIGRWAIRSQSSDADGIGTLGIVLIDTDAAAAAALPDPQDDNASWLYLGTQYQYVGNTLDADQQWLTEKVDVRSRRRFRSEQERLNVVFENISPAAMTLTLVWDFRVLLYIR